jgi:hypothetical protein
LIPKKWDKLSGIDLERKMKAEYEAYQNEANWKNMK